MKRTVRAVMFFVFIAQLFAVLSLLSSCDEKIEPKNRLFYEYFDTVCTVYDYTGGTVAEFNEITDQIEAELETCHELFDIYNDYSGVANLKTVNDNAGVAPVTVDVRIIDMLEFSVEMYERTNGHVNVAMGSVLSLWHRLRAEGQRIPTEQELSEAGAHISIENLVIDRENMTVFLADPESSLDVGAIAKGYTAERIAKMLEERGISGYALNFGGNLRVIGTKPNGDGWVSGVTNPDLDADERYVYTLTISDSSLVTSGTYERFYTVEGVSYHHIINKDTLMPHNNYLSVTIHTPSSAVADALSTALFNMTLEEAEQIIASFEDTKAIFVLPSGEVKVI